MRRSPEHDLREGEQSFAQQSSAYLAVVDLESYPPFVAEDADYLDLLRHLCAEVDALTATMWEVPDGLLKLRVSLAESHETGEELARSGHHVFASGWVRTGGRLALATRERLLDCARHREDDLLRTPKSLNENWAARLLLVHPGVYAITIFSGLPHGALAEKASGGEAIDYCVVLRRYPHPPPRGVPVRLRGFAPFER